MVVAVRTVLVRVFVLLVDVLAEALFAFLAGEDQFSSLFEAVVGGFGMAFRAVEPLFAAGTPNGNLGVEDVLAGYL